MKPVWRREIRYKKSVFEGSLIQYIRALLISTISGQKKHSSITTLNALTFPGGKRERGQFRRKLLIELLFHVRLQ